MRQHGYSLMGLLVSLAIAATLMMMAYPSFSGMIDRSRLHNSVDRLYEGIWYTRSSAVSQQQPVVMTARTPDWADGWEVFLDRNADGLQQSDEPILRVANALPDDLRIHSNQGIGGALYYHPDGHSRKPGGALQMGRLTLCLGNRAQAIIINAVGRPRIEPQARSDC